MKDDKLNKIVNSIIKAIDERMQKKPKAYYTEAEVLRVDKNNGVAYVHIPGGVDETPVRLTIDANEGDTVQIRVGEGSATITGNRTAPPTDDKLAEEALQEAQNSAKGLQKIDEALENGDFESAELTNIVTMYCLSTSNSQFIKATGYDWQTTPPAYVSGLYYWTKTVTTMDDGTTIETDPIFDLTAQSAAEADAIAKSNDNHFWHDSSGVYVTKTANNAASGYATRLVSEGIQHTYNGNPLFTLSSSALTFYQSDGSTPMATYGSGGVYLYAGGAQAAQFTSSGITLNNGASYKYGEFSTSGLTIYNGSGTTIAQLGYGSTQGASSFTPYYTFGTRNSGTLGGYSTVEGRNGIASDADAHAEGNSCTASGAQSHAEGYNCTAGYAKSHAEGDSTTVGYDSSYGFSNGAHAEGVGTTAKGTGAHAEGYYTTAYGEGSHASGIQTTVTSNIGAAAVGKYNNYQSGDLFEVGNGTSSSRSNAFTVDSSGNATVKGTLTAGNIDSGSDSFAATSSGSYSDKTVSFNKTFPSTPNVTLTMSVSSSTTAANIGSTIMAVISTSTTSFTARFYNNSGASKTPSFKWIAIA